MKINELKNGFVHCPDERILWRNSEIVNIYRLHNISECDVIGFPRCDNSTCYNSNFSTCVEGECFVSHVICTSWCDDDDELCKGVFQCADDSLIFYSQFCDGIIDCFDASDEFINQPGFKCNKCILPQSNLYDDFAHCGNNSDYCFARNDRCFKCFDKRLLISSSQVCDGVGDCYDLSDECLCDEYFNSEMCWIMFENDINFQCFDNENLKPRNNLLHINNPTFTEKKILIECYTKFFKSIPAMACEGTPECKDYSDECQCPNPPSFCNDSCHSYFPMGDRYCDGVEDPAWQYINKSECPQGFDELLCRNRFKCRAADKVSIDVQQVCNGKADCDDGSDENNCPVVSNIQSIFSSDTEMIANPAIKSAFWLMGFLVIIGNACVIITTITLLKTSKRNTIMFQNIIILNISFSDFLMGIYLLAIASYDALFSGFYGTVDREWRSSLWCSIIGSLAVISSETSCFLMVILTAFRLRNVIKALESMSFSLRPWKCCIGVAWFLSLIISIVPMLDLTSQYFLHSFSYSSPFQRGLWYIGQFQQFVCRYAALSNTTVTNNGNKFQSTKEFIINNSSDEMSVKLFGYYGGTSVCMPRFYVAYGGSSWEYTILIITLNFLSFLFIAISYVVINKYSTASSAKFRCRKPNSQSARMQKRIARIIATDFCCWIPICIMAYVRLLGIEFSDIAYQISAVLLLPINSVMNPFLFSSLSDKLIDLCRHKCQKPEKTRVC